MSGFAESIGLETKSRIARSVNILHAAALPPGGTETLEHEDAVLKAAAQAAGLPRWPTYTELAGAHQRKLREMQADSIKTTPRLWQQANEDLRALVRHLIRLNKEVPEQYRKAADESMFGAAPLEVSSEGLGCRLEGLTAILYTPHTVRSPVTKGERTEYIPSAESPGFVLWMWTTALETGYRGPFPWSKLIQWWHKEAPADIDEANERLDPMMPAPLIMVDKKSRLSRLYSPPGHLVRRDDGQAYLPGFAPGEQWGSKLPCLPLALYDLGVKDARHPGRGAPIALRLFVETILSVPQAYRNDPYGVRLPPARLRDWIPLLYGKTGLHRYRPSTYWPRLREAFDSLLTHEARIPWYNPETGEGGARLVVTPVDIPRNGRLDDWVRFIVCLPPGSDQGPLIDRPALRQAGLNSAPAYRMALSLSFAWHDRGHLRVPIDRRKQRWAQTRQERKYSPVTEENLLWMAYPAGSKTAATKRKQLQRARQALKFLTDIGFAKTTQFGGIMPGAQWAGWGDREIVIPASAS